MCLQRSLHRFDFLAAIARLQIHFALEVGQSNGAIAGAQTHPPRPGHVDFYIHPVALGMESDNADLDPAFANLRVEPVVGSQEQTFDSGLA